MVFRLATQGIAHIHTNTRRNIWSPKSYAWHMVVFRLAVSAKQANAHFHMNTRCSTLNILTQKSYAWHLMVFRLATQGIAHIHTYTRRIYAIHIPGLALWKQFESIHVAIYLVIPCHKLSGDNPSKTVNMFQYNLSLSYIPEPKDDKNIHLLCTITHKT